VRDASDRCPICGGHASVRDLLGSLGVPNDVGERERRGRTMLYYAAVVGEDERVCDDCRGLLPEGTDMWEASPEREGDREGDTRPETETPSITIGR